jgi:hypothetical protein
VLQDNVTPGWYSFENLGGLAGADLISAAGYDYAGDEDSRNALLAIKMNALDPANSDYSVIIQTDEIVPMRVPKALLGFIVEADGTQTSTVDAPASGASVNVIRMERKIVAPTNVESYQVYDLKAYLSYDRVGVRVVQRKQWIMQVFTESSDAPIFKLRDVPELFDEFEPIAPSGRGDVIMTLSVDNITQLKADLVLTCEDIAVSYTPLSLQFSVKDSQNMGGGQMGGRLVSF